MTAAYQRVHPFDVAELQTEAGCARVLRLCRRRGLLWYYQQHSHTCGGCSHTISHTGLNATRQGDSESHRCRCGRDIRGFDG